MQHMINGELMTTSASDLMDVISTASPIFNDSNLTSLAQQTPKGYTGLQKMLIIIAGTLLSIVTVSGNVLVMLSFRIDKHLQVISNYFLFSLAVADLTIGLVSCPLMTFYTAHGEWTLGYPICQIWLSIDYLMSNASVWNLLLISFDRYFSVTRPLTYRPRRTTKKALIMIGSTYVLSLALWPPWIIAWPYIEGEWLVEKRQCMVQFLQTNAIATIGTIMAAFYVPVTIMIILYSKVYCAAQQRQRELKVLQGFSFRKKSMKKHAAKPPKQPLRQERDSFCSAEDTDNISEANIINAYKVSAIELPSSHTQTVAFTAHAARPPRGRGRLSRSKVGCFPCRHRCRLRQPVRGPATTNIYGESSSICITETERSAFSGISGPDPTVLENAIKPLPTPAAPYDDSAHLRNQDSSGDPLIEATLAKMKRQKRSSQRLTASSSTRSSERRRSHAFCPEGYSTRGEYTVVIHLPCPMSDIRKSKSEVVVYESQSDSESQSNTDVFSGLLDQESSLGVVTTSTYRRASGRSLEGGLRESLIRLAGLTGGPALIANVKGATSPTAPLQPGIQSLITKDVRSANRNRNNRKGDKKQESKAAKTLSAILLAFILTWAPYSIIICIETFYRNTVPPEWFTFSYYLCYINSTVNPILYAFCNPNFKRTYIRILTCKWRTSRHGITSGLGPIFNKLN